MKNIILLGATSYVAKQFLRVHREYLENGGYTFYASVRSKEKAELLREYYPMLKTLIADLSNEADLDSALEGKDVALNFAGPYIIFGETVVKACIKNKVHYLDLTGEPPFIKNIIDKYDEMAKEAKVLILPSMGFDSIPSDMGTYILGLEAQEKYGEKLNRLDILYSASGGFNGGTIASALLIKDKISGKDFANPHYYISNKFPDSYKNEKLSDYLDSCKKTVTSFFMEPVNSKIIHYSKHKLANSSPYTDDFVYREWSPIGGKGLSSIKISAANISQGLVDKLFSKKIGKKFVKTFLPKPGEGPSLKAMDGGGFTAKLYGKTKSGEIRATMKSSGDPGNVSTVKLIKSAMRAVLELETENYGVSTSSVSFKRPFLKILNEEGISFKVD